MAEVWGVEDLRNVGDMIKNGISFETRLCQGRKQNVVLNLFKPPFLWIKQVYLLLPLFTPN